MSQFIQFLILKAEYEPNILQLLLTHTYEVLLKYNIVEWLL